MPEIIMKTVLHLIYADAFSGAETVAANIIKNLPPEWVGYYVAPQGSGIARATEMGIKTVTCNTHSVSEIQKLIKKMNPDAVHAHDPHMSMNAALSGAKFVAHLHCNCPWMPKINLNSIALAYACKKAGRVFCVSPSIENEFVFSSAMKGKSQILYNFVDSDEVKKLADTGTVEKYDICFTGRMTEVKQPEKFVSLVAELKKEKDNVKAVMIGDGEKREETERLAEELGVSENIFFAGYDPNPFRYMKNSKVGVLTSSSEGFGLVAVEAMIFGLPFVAFPTGGLTDIITDKNGKLCGNIDEMKDEVIKLLTDEKYYSEKSAAAEKSSLCFTDKEKYMTAVIEAYNNL